METKLETYPKLLILCHNLYENTNNIGKTLISLLNSWPKDKLCQVYLRDDIPTFNYCDNYYRILDKEIIKSYYKGRNVVGTVLKKEDNNICESNEIDTNEQNMYNLGNKRIPLISMFRDLLWKRKSWKNDKFNAWLDEQKPDVMLFVPNDYELIYPIANYIASYLHIPIVPYYMDDAFYFNTFVSPIDYLRRLSIRRKGKKIIDNASDIITIGPKMSEEYNKRFNKNCIELMNSVTLTENNNVYQNDIFTFSYVGNLHSNRWKSIVKIGQVLDTLDKKAIINLYTASNINKKMNKKLSSVESIKMCGKLSPNEVDEVLKKSDALLFVESFNRKSAASTMYSLSTKIPEYMNSRRPIFAYGPKNISSMEYLKKNNLAIVCTKKENIEEDIKKVFDANKYLDFDYISKFVCDNHNILKNREKLESIIFKAVGKEQ